MIDDFTKEEKLSGGAVFERGVKQSKEHKAIRRLAEPLMKKHWHDSVTNLHRIYRVAEYLFKRSKRPKQERQNLKEVEVVVPEGVKVKIKRMKK
tara:strand:+ start:87 stop:368 length:282 start_codon:yes stop_codon:yes gene_type:complete